MAFSPTWFLLEQEGLLAQACLCNGLTALRRANLGDKKGLPQRFATEVSDRQARRDLVELEEAGLLLRIGKGAGTVFQRTDRTWPDGNRT